MVASAYAAVASNTYTLPLIVRTIKATAENSGRNMRKSRPRKRPRKTPPDAPKRPNALNPAALTPAEMAEVLTRTGGEEVDEAGVRADIEAGAPTNPDGSLNIVVYAAWLARAEIDGGLNGG